MNQSVKILEKIYNEMGSELIELVKDLGRKDIIYMKENEYIIDHRFKRLIRIVADSMYYSKESIDIDLNNFRLTTIVGNLADKVQKSSIDGNDNIVDRLYLFLFMLNLSYIGRNDIGAVVENIIKGDTIIIKRNVWTRLLYFIKFNKKDYYVDIDSTYIIILSLISGKSVYDETDSVVSDFNLHN